MVVDGVCTSSSELSLHEPNGVRISERKKVEQRRLNLFLNKEGRGFSEEEKGDDLPKIRHLNNSDIFFGQTDRQTDNVVYREVALPKRLSSVFNEDSRHKTLSFSYHEPNGVRSS